MLAVYFIFYNSTRNNNPQITYNLVALKIKKKRRKQTRFYENEL